MGEDETVYAMGGVVDPTNNVPSASMHILLPDKGGGAGGYGWAKAKDMPSPLAFARGAGCHRSCLASQITCVNC